MEMIVDKEFKKALKEGKSLVVRLNERLITIEFPKDRDPTERLIFNKKQTSKNKEAVFVLDFAGYDINPALFNMLKINDKLNFRARTNNNQYLSDAGLYKDELCLSVFRKMNEEERQIINELVIASSITPNNSARAIRGFYGEN